MKAWSPPAGWERVEPRLEGFELWAPPRPAEDAPEGPVPVRCPQCGAAAAFDVAKGAVACSFCGWAAEQRPEVVGRGAQEAEFTRAALEQGAQGFGVDRRELACRGCGAVLALEAGAMSATCPFCASNEVAVREHATVQGIRPSAILPFGVRGAECRSKAADWLGSGWFHPPDLARLASVDAFVGIYVPFWTFSADVDSDWKALVGVERRVSSYNPRTRQTEWKTVVDWYPRSGHVRIALRDLLVPGTTRLSERILERLDGAFDLDRLATYEPTILAGFQAQTYDVALPDAWERGRHRMRERARSACRSDIGSAHVRDFSMTADLEDESWRHVLLPIWVSAYRYGGRTWVVLVDGVGGRVVGQKPVAWWKVWTAVALLLTPGVGLLVASIPLLVIGVGAVLFPIGLVLAVLAGIGSWVLYAQAVDSEAE